MSDLKLAFRCGLTSTTMISDPLWCIDDTGQLFRSPLNQVTDSKPEFGWLPTLLSRNNINYDGSF